MAVLERIQVFFDADVRAALDALDTLGTRVERTARTVTARFDRIGSKLQGFGAKLSLGVTAPLTLFGSQALKAASDAQELQNLIEVTFGDATDDIRSWADAASRDMQRSRTAMLRAAGDFAAFLKPLGVAPDSIAPMSKALTALVTDLSSFRNISEEVVQQRLASGLFGETEAVRRLGIDIGQAAIEAELLRLGFEGNAEEATQAQKVMARFNLILAQSRDAQGDAVRTAQEYENQTRALGAALQDLREGLGNELIPVMARVVTTTARGIRAFNDLDAETKRSVVRFAALAAAIGPGLVALGTFIRVLGFAGNGLITFGKTFAKTVRLVLVGSAKLVGAFLSLPGAILGTLAAAVVFRRTLETMVDGLAGVIGAAFHNEVVVPLLSGLRGLRRLLPDVGKDLFDSIFGAVPDVAPVEAAGDRLRRTLFEAARQSGEDVDALKAKLGELGEFLSGVVPEGARALGDVLGSAFSDGEEGARGLSDALDGVFGQVDRLPGGGDADVAKLKEEFEDLEESVRTPKEELEATNRELDELREKLTGVGIEGARVDEVFTRARAAARKKFEEENEATAELRDSLKNVGESAATSFARAALEGRGFGDVLRSLQDQLVDFVAQQLIARSLTSAFGGAAGSLFGFAKGGAFDRGHVVPFARGGVVDRPTLFPMARGAGLMGEAGPEAVLPLQRTSGGDLGVKAQVGGGQRPQVNVIVNAPPGTQARTSRRQRGGGLEEIEVFIDRAVGEALERPGSRSHGAMTQTFGARVRTTSR